MNQRVEVDLADMEKRLKYYVNKGRVAGSTEVRKEPFNRFQKWMLVSKN